MSVSTLDQSSRSEEVIAMDDFDDKPAALKRSYPDLVRLMSRYKDLSLFRSFNDLHLTNLLRMQAELQYLEFCLEVAREEDKEARGDIRPQFIKNFALIRETAEAESTQHDLLEEIAVKLKEYDTALINYMTICKALKPNKREFEVLKTWIDEGIAADVSEGKTFPQGIEMFIWDNKRDLINLCDKGGDRDKFTEWIEHLLNLQHKLTPSKDTKDEHIRYSSDHNIARASRYASVALSSLMPTLAILVLHFVKREITRLGLIIVFTTAFSMILALFTTAKKMEVFASTAAFAAVEVVFIGTSSGNGTKGA